MRRHVASEPFLPSLCRTTHHAFQSRRLPIRRGRGVGPGHQSCHCVDMADDAPPHLPQEGAAAGAASAASSPRGSLAGEATEPSPRSSLTGEATGPPRKGKSKLVSLSNKVLMTVRRSHAPLPTASGAHWRTQTRGSC